MGKRKRSKSRDRDYNDILRKIQKIASKSKKRQRSVSSESSASDHSYRRYYESHHGDDYYDDYNRDYQGEHSSYISENFEEAQNELVELADSPPRPSTSAAPPAPSALPESPALPASPATPARHESAAGPAPIAQAALSEPDVVTSENVQTKPLDDETVPSLEPEILDLLGEDPTRQKNCGENLHKDIASRWTHILTNGLTKEIQLDLVKRYLPPENCPNIRVPILNLEIKAALLEVNVKKDLYSQSKQNQLSSSLAAIGQVLNWALASKNVPQDIIKTLSDAGRLICDSHYKESQSRRFAALNTLNKNIRDTVKNTKIDEHLFGSDLSDHIKSSKAIIKTGSEMKSVAQRPPYRTTAATQSQRGSLNSRGAPPRVAAAEPRPPPAPRRPPRDRRYDAPRGRRATGYSRHHAKRRY